MLSIHEAVAASHRMCQAGLEMQRATHHHLHRKRCVEPVNQLLRLFLADHAVGL